MATETDDAARRKSAISDYRKKLLSHKELEGRVRSGFHLLNPNFLNFVFRISEKGAVFPTNSCFFVQFLGL